MRKEDINRYTTTSMRVPSQHTEGEFTKSAGATVATIIIFLLYSVRVL